MQRPSLYMYTLKTSFIFKYMSSYFASVSAGKNHTPWRIDIEPDGFPLPGVYSQVPMTSILPLIRKAIQGIRGMPVIVCGHWAVCGNAARGFGQKKHAFFSHEKIGFIVS